MPAKGTVINASLADVDPVNPILVNVTGKEGISINNADDYRAKLKDIYQDVQFVSDRFVLPYSQKAERRLQRLLHLTESARGKAYTNSDAILTKYFQGKKSILSVRLEILFKVLYHFFKRVGKVFILGDIGTVVC